MSMTERNSCPNRNSQITGCTTLNASTQGCRTRACSFRPVRYQVCTRVVPNGTVLDDAVGYAALDGTDSSCTVAITCSPPQDHARSGIRCGLRSLTRCSGARCAAG